MINDDLGTHELPEVVQLYCSCGVMKSALAQNRSGFFSVIRVIVVGPRPLAR